MPVAVRLQVAFGLLPGSPAVPSFHLHGCPGGKGGQCEVVASRKGSSPLLPSVNRRPGTTFPSVRSPAAPAGHLAWSRCRGTSARFTQPWRPSLCAVRERDRCWARHGGRWWTVLPVGRKVCSSALMSPDASPYRAARCGQQARLRLQNSIGGGFEAPGGRGRCERSAGP